MSIEGLNNTANLKPLNAHSSEAEKKRAKKICNQFEALFVAKLLGSMRSTEKSGLFGDGFGADTYQGLFESKVAEKIASTGEIGIGKVLYQGLFSDSEIGRGPDSIKSNFTFPKTKRSIQTDGNFDQRVQKFNDIIASASKRYNLPKELIVAVIKAESYCDAFAVSKAGAKGLMQLMDETASDLGVQNSFDPKENVFGGTQYLKSQLEAFNGNLELALAAYNAGPANVEKYNGVPPFKETQAYVQKIKDSLYEMENSNDI
jgi:Rod binding domain-containing protein